MSDPSTPVCGEPASQLLRHVVMFSGGVGSWAAAKRVAARYGTTGLTLLFTDTLMEDEDLYRFLPQAAANVGGELVMIAEGRTPWEVFFDERFLGNSRIDPCSKILKRQMADRWLAFNRHPSDTVVYVGIDWSEEHRFTRLRDRKFAGGGWRYEAPLCEPPYLTKAQMFVEMKTVIPLPRLYAMGFEHNNCGGFCIKARCWTFWAAVTRDAGSVSLPRRPGGGDSHAPRR